MNDKVKKILIKYMMELLIVIIGITIAFWLNNVGTENKNNQEKIVYLKDIRDDLTTDSIRLVNNVKNNEAKSMKLNTALEMIQNSASLDSILPNVVEIGNYDFFSPDNFTLTSLLQSGDFKLINSTEIKKELLRLLKMYESIENMQKNFLQALDDGYFPMILTKIDLTSFEAIEPKFFYGAEIKNYCAFTLNETSLHINSYKHAQKQVNKVKYMIEAELEKDK